MSFTIPFGEELLDLRPCEDEPGFEALNKAGTRSGVWECSLRTLAPLSIKSVFENLGKDGAVYIPGSSIRGMVRNVAEMLGAGCGRYFDDGMRLPDNLKVCGPAGACLVCRIFGFTEGEYSWASKVRFSDTARSKEIPLVTLRVPNQREELENNGRGWRAFRSFGWVADGGSPVRCVGSDVTFSFQVHYTNLSAEQYDLLLFALTLQDGNEQLVHKLGYGKSLDLGACVISVRGSPKPGPSIQGYLNRQGYLKLFREGRKK